MDPGFYPNGPSGVFNLTAVEPLGIKDYTILYE